MKPYDDGEDFSPAGLKVLVVDDDPFCLTVMERMLRECKYSVTTCSRATKALSILRDRSAEAFDVVISDVHMPDMDGFKLLELIGLEMDLPVIMMSANGETDAVMKGIIYGACDYLVKPVRIEELRNIWQHVVRKRGGTAKDLVRDETSEEWEDTARTDPLRKKKRSSDSGEEPLRNISSVKKARVVWSFDLHQQFVKAINLVGIDKAVPKRILEVMNIQGLTRENVASHLQKYRLYLKRLSGVNPEPFPIASFQAYEGAAFGGAMHVQHPLPAFRSNPSAFGKLPAFRSNPSAFGKLPAFMSNSSAFGKPLGQYDPGTLATLAQLQALQQAAHEKGQIEAGLVTFPGADTVIPNPQTNANGRPVEYGELFTAGPDNNLSSSYGSSQVELGAAPAPASQDLGALAANFVPSSPPDVSFLNTVFP